MSALFQDRRDAGRTLAAALFARSNIVHEPVVLGLPRGGVPVAFTLKLAFVPAMTTWLWG